MKQPEPLKDKLSHKHSNIYKMSFNIRDVFHTPDSLVELEELLKPQNSADHKVLINIENFQVDGLKRV